jgi:hypothetical protein
MNHDQSIVLLTIGGGVLLLLAAALLMLFQGATDQEIARRISKLREGATVAQPQSSRFLPALISLTRRLGNGMRERMMSAKDAEALAKTLRHLAWSRRRRCRSSSARSLPACSSFPS